MARPSKYPSELRERAVRLVIESRDQYETEFAAIKSVASKLGIASPETWRKWLRQAEINTGLRSGVTNEEPAELKRLKRENAELRRANEILKAASAFCARTAANGLRSFHCLRQLGIGASPSSTGQDCDPGLHRRAECETVRTLFVPTHTHNAVRWQTWWPTGWRTDCPKAVARQTRVVLWLVLGLTVRHEILPRNLMDHIAWLRREPHIPDALTPA